MKCNTSNTVFVVGILIFMFLPNVASLKCYSCLSYLSWEDCDMTTKIVSCSILQTRCAKVYMHGTREVYARGCETNKECTDKASCKTPGISSCKIDCCIDDRCNSAAKHSLTWLPTIVSAMLSLAVAVG